MFKGRKEKAGAAPIPVLFSTPILPGWSKLLCHAKRSGWRGVSLFQGLTEDSDQRKDFCRLSLTRQVKKACERLPHAQWARHAEQSRAEQSHLACVNALL